MKTLFFSLSVLLCSMALNLIAQEAIHSPKKWKMNMVEFSTAVVADRYNHMTREKLMAIAEHPEELQRNLDGFEEDFNTNAVGVALYGSIGFSLNNPAADSKMSQEWRVGMGIHSPREAMITYKDEARDTSIVYCHIQSEVTFDGAYYFMGTIGKSKRFYWQAGFGGQIGASPTSNLMILSGQYFEPGVHPSEQEAMQEETYSAKAVGYARAYMQLGVGYRFGEPEDQRWILSLGRKHGVGAQQVFGGETNYISHFSSFLVSLNYRF